MYNTPHLKSGDRKIELLHFYHVLGQNEISLNELNFHCVMSNPMKHNRQNHTHNGRTHKYSSHKFIENEQVLIYINSVSNVSQLTQPQVRTCLQERTNYLQRNEKGIHMFLM